jgi:Ca-activated chloride channel family protein
MEYEAAPSAYDMSVDGDDMGAAEVSGDRYGNVPENQYNNTAQNAVSTFSIDVDTAAYSNVRRYLRSGSLPPTAAVRIEEFINYFSYDYKGPGENAPFSIHTEAAAAPWAKGHQLLKVGLQGFRMDTSDLPKRNLVFLVDTSGSMSSHDKLPLLKEGFKMLAQTLREEDRISIVAYASAAGAVLLPTSGYDQESIMNALDNLSSGGSTNGGQGIELAYKLAEQNFDPDAINRIILASDGDFNVGMTSKDALIDLIEEKRKSGVYFSALGFGRGNLNDATMEQLADKGNGNYSYIDSAAEAQKVLVDEGGSTLITIAKDVKVQVQFNDKAVESYRLIGYENRMLKKEDFENDKVDAGELGPGHSVTALYEVVLKPDSGAKKLVDVHLRYKRPDSNKSQLIVHSEAVTRSKLGRGSREMRFATAVAGFGLLLKKSEHKGSLTWKQLQGMAEEAVGQHKSKHRQEFLELVGVAARIAGPQAQLAN